MKLERCKNIEDLEIGKTYYIKDKFYFYRDEYTDEIVYGFTDVQKVVLEGYRKVEDGGSDLFQYVDEAWESTCVPYDDPDPLVEEAKIHVIERARDLTLKLGQTEQLIRNLENKKWN